jgi:hypothetical protein
MKASEDAGTDTPYDDYEYDVRKVANDDDLEKRSC